MSTSLKMTTKAVSRLFNALSTLDAQGGGTMESVEGGPISRTKPAEQPFKFNGPTRLALTKILLQLRAVVEAYHEARAAAIVHFGLNKQTDDPAKRAAFDVYQEALLQTMHTLEVPTIKEADLKLDVNAIPFKVLIEIAPLVDGMKVSAVKGSFPKLPQVAAE